MKPQMSYWQGYVKLKLTGKQIEAFINSAAQHKLQLWDIRLIAEDAAEFKILLQHFFRLRPLLRKTSCKIHVIERYGAPFFWDRLGSRKFLDCGNAAVCNYLISDVLGYLASEGYWQ